MDVLARVVSTEGEPRLLHIEAQAQPQRRFGCRMFDHFGDIHRRHGDTPILSLAVLAYPSGGVSRTGRFQEERDGRIFLWFEYGIIPLADLDARDYLEIQDPVPHGLMGLFRREGLDGARLRADSLRKVLRLTEAGSPLRQILLTGLDRYFVLTQEEGARFRQLVTQPEYREVQEMLMLHEERALKRGRREGRREGRVIGAQDALLNQLRSKFGAVPEEIEAAVRAMRSPKEIDPYLERVLTVGRLEDMGFPTNGRAARH